MNDNECLYHHEHKSKLERLEQENQNHENRLNICEQNQSIIMERIANALDKLAPLPEAINALKETNIILQNKIDNVDSEVKSLKSKIEYTQKKIETIDNEGNFNIRLWTRDNWISIVIILMALIFLGKNILESIF